MTTHRTRKSGDYKDNYLDDDDNMITDDDESYFNSGDLDLDAEGHNHSAKQL